MDKLLGADSIKAHNVCVVSSIVLKTLVDTVAMERSQSFELCAQQLVALTFENFTMLQLRQSPIKLLAGYESKLDNFVSNDVVSWELQLDRHLSIRMRLTAREYNKTLQQLVLMCIIESLHIQGAI